MSNLLTSTQTTATTAPSFYTNYLQNQANAATSAANTAAANYVAPTALQTGAWQEAGNVAGSYQPQLTNAANTLNNATTATNPLAAASPYLSSAMQDPSQAAQGYVSQYLMPAAQSLSDINQNNINTNLAPMANAGAIGSGQYGSQRNAQVLGQTEALANQQTNSQIANMLNTGYQSALQTAEQQNALAGQAGATAANAAGTGQSNLINAGTAQSNAGVQSENARLADINAQATLGAQQQTALQNQYLYPLSVYNTAAGALSGANIPTTTNTSLTASPLSGAAALGAGAMAIPSVNSFVSSSLGKLLGGSSGPSQVATDTANNINGSYDTQATQAATAQGYTADPSGNGTFTNSSGNTFVYDPQSDAFIPQGT